MSDMVKERKTGDIRHGSESGSSGVRDEFQTAGVSFKGYSRQDKESAQLLQEQGKNLAAMGSNEPDSKNIDKEAAAIAAASLLPSYLVSKTKDKILDKAEEKKDKNKSQKDRHRSRSDENKSESEQMDACNRETADPAKRKAMKERVKEQGRKQEKTQSRNHGAHMEGASAGTSDFWKSERGCSERGCNDKGISWAQETVKQTNISREEKIRNCGINHPDDHEEHIRRPAEEANDYVNNDAREREDEPEVCSGEARKKSKEQKQAKEQKEKEKKKKLEKDKRSKRKEAARAKGTKKMMIRRFIVQQGMDPENPNLESGIGGLMVQLIRHDISRLLWKIGKKITGLFFIVLSAVLPFVIMTAVIIFPIFLFVILVLHPISFFLGIFDGQEELLNNPEYVKTVVEAKYTDFYEDISDFANVTYIGGNKCNQVTYADGYRSNTGAVMAVYLSKVCSDPGYSKMEAAGNKGGPPYCLVDTKKERDILREVFEQFNYGETEEITATVKYGVYHEDTQETEIVEEQIQAQKMTVHTLSLKKWKELHLDTLSEDAKEVLKVLAKYADSYMNGTGNSDYGPITNIPIPEGADQNLVYMAAFIKAEAGGEIAVGKVAVAYVILNRAGGPGGNIIGALTAPGAFSCYIPNHTVEPYIAEYAQMAPEQRDGDPCWQAAVGAYTGTYENPIGDFRYYCNPKGCSAGETAQWAKIRAKNGEGDIIVIGNHVFCRNCW